MRAWANSHWVLQAALDALAQEHPEVLSWTVAFEYELPCERRRRPDVVLLTSDRVLVLEFKDHPSWSTFRMVYVLGREAGPEYGGAGSRYVSASHSKFLTDFSLCL